MLMRTRTLVSVSFASERSSIYSTKPVSDWDVGIRNLNFLITSKPRESNLAVWGCGNAYTSKYDGHAGCALV